MNAAAYRSWGIAFAVVGVLAFSLRPILIKLSYAAHPVSPNTLLFLRMALSLPFFLVIAWWLRNQQPALTRRDWAAVAGLGFLGYYAASFLDFLGLQYVGAGVGRLILFLYPTMVLSLAFLFLKKTPRRREIVSLVMSYAGIALVVSDQIGTSGEGKLFLLGVLLVFASALCYAVYLVAGSQVVKRVGSMRFTAYSMAVATAPALVQFFALEPVSALALPASVWTYAIILATVSTVLPLFLQAEALRRIGATEFALVGAVSPVSVARDERARPGRALRAAADGRRRAGDRRRASRFPQERLNMDIGIRGKTALVCAASKGLGKGCALSLAREGVNLVITARGKEALEATAAEIEKKYGVKVVPVAGDITTAEGRAAALKACPSPDILVNNAGGPPPGDFRNWSREDWVKALDANMLTPIELIKATRRRHDRAPLRPHRQHHLRRGEEPDPRARPVERRAQRPHRLRRRPVAPDRAPQRHHQRPAAGAVRHRPAALAISSSTRRRWARPRRSWRKIRADANPAGRFGTIEEFGDACAYLCSAQAGFITGQNFLLDGGAYPGTF